MKKTTLFLLFIFAVLNIKAQTVAWSSDCEDLTGFQAADVDGDGYNWLIASGGEALGFSTGQLLASFHYFGCDNLLATPAGVIVLPANATDITFKLRVAASSAQYPLESFEIFVFDEADFNSEYKIYYERLQVGGAGTSKVISAPIPGSLAGKTIRLAIRHFQEAVVGEYFLIDDFEVSYTETLSIDDNELNQVQVYPNPVVSALKFKAKLPIDNIIIINELGQKIKQVKGVNIINNEIDLSNLSKGIYFVRFENENGVTTKKIVKK